MMQKSGTIVSYGAEELRSLRDRGEDPTDWARLNAMTEEELEALDFLDSLALCARPPCSSTMR